MAAKRGPVLLELYCFNAERGGGILTKNYLKILRGLGPGPVQTSGDARLHASPLLRNYQERWKGINRYYRSRHRQGRRGPDRRSLTVLRQWVGVVSEAKG